MYRPLPLIIVLLGIVASLATYVYLLHDESVRLERAAHDIASRIDPEEIAALKGSEADLANPAYARLKADLVQYRSEYPDYRFVYLVGRKADGMLFFYVDSEDASSPDYSPPGQVYPEATPDMVAVLDGNDSGHDESTDRWGSWSSGYAAIRSGTSTVALLGVDRVIGARYMRSIVLASVPLVGSILVMLLSLVARAWFVRRSND